MEAYKERDNEQLFDGLRNQGSLMGSAIKAL